MPRRRNLLPRRRLIRNSRSPTPATTSASSTARAGNSNSPAMARSCSSCARASERSCEQAGDARSISGRRSRSSRSFRWLFGRKKEDGPVVEVSCGDAWYTTDAYDGPRQFQIPEAWRNYVGHYRSEDPWMGSIRVFILKGRCWSTARRSSPPAICSAARRAFQHRMDPLRRDRQRQVHAPEIFRRRSVAGGERVDQPNGKRDGNGSCSFAAVHSHRPISVRPRGWIAG